MSKNQALAGAVLDASFGEIRRPVAYKAKLAAGRVVVADRFFSSSKTCSDCGHVVDVLPLHIRARACSACRHIHDRDINAAKNLELVGRATPKPAPMPLCGDMEALAVEQSATKRPWLNRKPDRRTHVRTNEKAECGLCGPFDAKRREAADRLAVSLEPSIAEICAKGAGGTACGRCSGNRRRQPEARIMLLSDATQRSRNALAMSRCYRRVIRAGLIAAHRFVLDHQKPDSLVCFFEKS